MRFVAEVVGRLWPASAAGRGSAGEKGAHHPRRRAIHHVPRRDAIVTVEIKLEHLAAHGVVEMTSRLEVEDAHGRHPRFVGGMVEQHVHFGQRQIRERLRGVEEIAHTHADRRLVRGKALSNIDQLGLVPDRVQRRLDVPSRRVLSSHGATLRRRRRSALLPPHACSNARVMGRAFGDTSVAGRRTQSRRSVRRVSARSALQVVHLTTARDVLLVRRDGYRAAVGAKGGGPRMVIPRGFAVADAWRRARSTRSAVSSVAGSLAPR